MYVMKTDGLQMADGSKRYRSGPRLLRLLAQFF